MMVTAHWIVVVSDGADHFEQEVYLDMHVAVVELGVLDYYLVSEEGAETGFL